MSNYPIILKASPSPVSLILSYFWKYLGENEFILRLLSLIFGTFSIAIIYKIGKELADEKVGIISSFLLALSPLHIWYSQKITPYTTLTLFSMLSLYFFIVFLKNDKLIFGLAYIIFNILSIYTHPIAFLTLLAEIIYFLFYWRRYTHLIKKWILANIVIFLFLIPGLINILFILSELFFKTSHSSYQRIKWMPPETTVKSIF